MTERFIFQLYNVGMHLGHSSLKKKTNLKDLCEDYC